MYFVLDVYTAYNRLYSYTRKTRVNGVPASRTFVDILATCCSSSDGFRPQAILFDRKNKLCPLLVSDDDGLSLIWGSAFLSLCNPARLPPPVQQEIWGVTQYHIHW
jgi:hypothetical protein